MVCFEWKIQTETKETRYICHSLGNNPPPGSQTASKPVTPTKTKGCAELSSSRGQLSGGSIQLYRKSNKWADILAAASDEMEIEKGSGELAGGAEVVFVVSSHVSRPAQWRFEGAFMVVSVTFLPTALLPPWSPHLPSAVAAAKSTSFCGAEVEFWIVNIRDDE